MTTEQPIIGETVANAALTPESFGRWLASVGFSAKTVSTRRSALRALAAAWPEALSAPAALYLSHPGFRNALNGLPGWQADEAKGLPRLLALMEDDARAMAIHQEFWFYEVNPGLSALGFGAERIGAWSRGAEMVYGLAKKVHEEFHGSDAVGEPHGPYLMALVDLPFSVFATRGGGDPAINGVLAAAAKRSHRAKALLFRVEWSAGTRMGLDPAAWAALVESHLPGFTARWAVAENERFVPMKGHELFIAASPDWRSDFRIVGDGREIEPAASFLLDILHPESLTVSPTMQGNVFPRFLAKRIGHDYRHDPRAAIVRSRDGGQRMLSPLEIMMILGFPQNFWGQAGEDGLYPFLGDSVAIPVAERAIRGLLRAAGLE